MSRMRVAVLAGLTGPRRRRPRGPGPRHAQPAVRHRELVRPPRRSRPQRARRGRHQDRRRHFPDGFYSASTSASGAGRPRSRCASSPRRSRAPTATSPSRSSKITWRANSKADWIAPGQFEEFGLSMRIPNTPGALCLPGAPDLQQRRGRQLERRRAERPSCARAGRSDRASPAAVVATRRATRRSRASRRGRTRRAQSRQRGARDVQGQDADRDHRDHEGRRDRRAQVQRPDPRQQGGPPRGAEVPS